MILRETDEPFIRQVAAHPAVWKYVSGIDDLRDYDLPDGVYYTLLNDGIKAGFMAFLPEDVGVSVHIAILPEHRGAWLEPTVKAVLADHGGKIIAKVRHHRVYALAYRVGFRTIGKDAEYTYMELK